MVANIEIKARVRDFTALDQRAGWLSGMEPLIIRQEQIEYDTPRGVLMLRISENQFGDLVYELRHDQADERNCIAASHDEVTKLKEVLMLAWGVKDLVRQERRLYLADNARVYLDRVDGVGEFVDLEIVLNEGQALADGERLAAELMQILGIDRKDIVEKAYQDLLLDWWQRAA